MRKLLSKLILRLITFLDGCLMWLNGYRKVKRNWVKSESIGGNTYMTKLPAGKPLTKAVRRSILIP